MRFLVVLAAVFGLGGAAQADELCNAAVHQRFDETRAFFKDVLAGCSDERGCYMVAHKVNRALPAAYSHQLRILRPSGATRLGVHLTAVEESADIAAPMTIVSGGAEPIALTGKVEVATSINEFRIVDPVFADETARMLISKARTVRWRFATTDGAQVVADFPMRGAGEALAWVDCMAAK